MAYLEHINNSGKLRFRLVFRFEGKRKSVSLTGFDEPAAEVAKEHVEHLIAQHALQRPPAASTMQWLSQLSIKLHDRLAAIGLVESRKHSDMPRMVVAYMRAYIKDRTDWRKPENYRQAVDKLEEYLKRDRPLSALTKGDADRFHRWMIDTLGMSRNTAGQHVKRCRQMIRHAVDDDLVAFNPFVGIKIDLKSDRSKNRYIKGVEANAILEACPDQEWRAIVALSRFAGLRCPSEVLNLKWEDVVWDRDRFKVRARKTERYGTGERIVPLFPEVRRELADLQEVAGKGAYVISTYRSSEANLRTTFLKIVDRAGVDRFPKPFNNLRASCRRDLKVHCIREGIDEAAVTQWLGHSKQVGEEYYDRVTEEDYRAAVGASVCPFNSEKGAKKGTHRVVLDNTRKQGSRKTRKKPSQTAVCSSAMASRYTPEDSNL